MPPENYYNKRLSELNNSLSILLRKKSWLAWARFVAVLLIAGCLYLQPYGWAGVITGTFILSVIFIKLVFADIDNNKSIEYTRQLLEINKDELKALDGNYLHFDDGAVHMPHDHQYANDLDIFGKASLYQYVNRCASYMGSSTIASWLLLPAKEETILQRQAAAKELHAETEWRQALQAYGKEKRIEQAIYQRLESWITEKNIFVNHHLWIVLQFLIPALLLSVITLNFFDIAENSIRNIFLLLSAVIALFISRKVVPLHNRVSKMTEELEVLSDSIRLIENKDFTSPLLTALQSAYKQKHSTASAEMKKLKGIVQRLDWRFNPVVFVPLAILFQWDLQQVIALEKWKQRNRANLIQWFEALGNFEAISSFATLHFNHPDWCFPALKKEHFFIEGKEIGHPLIGKNKRVNNAIDINDKGIIMLVTGSNMAGKSTYLRSIGINVILTMAGAVACAKSFSVTPVQLLTSMRIADNLEENTSTFYAELKKLKAIIEMVNKKEKVFILLDEILRGTNSLDRHTGAAALIKQLIRQEAAGIIATHDVELAKLEKEYPGNILNFHFDAEVNNEELYFDYRLKKGICTSINASLLMKKIGIEV